jgi:hypothetical protein
MPCFATGGAEWCNDYTVITRRRGDLKAWGLRDTYGSVAHTGMKKLTTTHARFVNKTSPPPNMTHCTPTPPATTSAPVSGNRR